jgi:hypothetical protein
MRLLLPLNRLAEHLRLPADWLRGEAEGGRIPCLKVGRRMLFNPEAVEEALAEQAARNRLQPCGS